MSSRDRQRHLQDRCQKLLADLLKDDDNKYCVDCDAKGPRWASWNLGIFLCIRCAGIHRNLGVHISKVKSVNLDSWTPEQVVSLQQMGNSRARAVYEANLPDAFRRPQTDSTLETFIRAKYEHKKYVAREWVPPSPPQVNWDKEIDEEIEKQKKKKKSVNSTSTSLSSEKKTNKPANNVVPKLLPKPKSSVSPKPGRSTPKKDTTVTADLLGTSESTSQNNSTDDMFSSFLSAPQDTQDTNKNNSENSKTDDLKSEEESFFNQPTPNEKEKSKMTKDSIMALYGQAPLKNISGQFPPPSGVYMPGFSQPGFPQPTNQMNTFTQGYNNFGMQNSFLQNGSIPVVNAAGTMQPQSFPVGYNQFNNIPAAQNSFNNQYQANQFTNMQGFPAPISANSNQIQNSAQFQVPNMNGTFMNSMNGSQTLTAGNSLAQQFGGLVLNQNVQGTMNAFPVQPVNASASLSNQTQSNGAWP